MKKFFGVLLTLGLLFGFNGLALAQNEKYNPEQLADEIITGVLPEEEFLNMNLSNREVLEVFKAIRDQRG